jgi:hypothetical protein
MPWPLYPLERRLVGPKSLSGCCGEERITYLDDCTAMEGVSNQRLKSDIRVHYDYKGNDDHKNK